MLKKSLGIANKLITRILARAPDTIRIRYYFHRTHHQVVNKYVGGVGIHAVYSEGRSFSNKGKVLIVPCGSDRLTHKVPDRLIRLFIVVQNLPLENPSFMNGVFNLVRSFSALHITYILIFPKFQSLVKTKNKNSLCAIFY